VTIRSREDLQTALRALGLRCSVEAFDGLAVAVPEPGEQRFASDDIRRRAIELARQHGFSHLAVELREAGSEPSPRATLPGD